MLTEGDKNALKLISLLPKNDATYIRTLIELLYKENLFVLRHRTNTGKTGRSAENGNEIEKSAVSPNKKLTIVNMFERRIKDLPESIGRGERMNRIAKINKHVTNGISYIVSFKLPKL